MENFKEKSKNSLDDLSKNFGQFNSMMNSLNGGVNSEINNLRNHLKRQVDCVIDLDKTFLEKRRKCLHDKISEFKKEDFDKFPEFVHPNSDQLMKLYDINFLNINQASAVNAQSTSQMTNQATSLLKNPTTTVNHQSTNRTKSSVLDSTEPVDFSSLIQVRTNILNSLINNINSLSGDNSDLNNLNSFNNLQNGQNLGNFNLTDPHFSAFNGLNSFNNSNNCNNLNDYSHFNNLNSLNFPVQAHQVKPKKKRGRSKLSPGTKPESKPRSKNKYLKAIDLTNKNGMLNHLNSTLNLTETNPLNLSTKIVEKSKVDSPSTCRKINYDYQTKTINDLVDHIPLDNVDDDGFLIYNKMIVKTNPAAFFNRGKRILCPNCPYISSTNFIYHSTCHKLYYDSEKEVQCNYCNWTVQKSRNFTTLMSKHFAKHFVGFLMVDQGLSTQHLSEEMKSKRWYSDLIAYQSKLGRPIISLSNDNPDSNQMNMLTEQLDSYLDSYTEKTAREKSKNVLSYDLPNDDGLGNVSSLNGDKSIDDSMKNEDLVNNEYFNLHSTLQTAREKNDSIIDQNHKQDDLEDKNLTANQIKSDLDDFKGLEAYQNSELNNQKIQESVLDSFVSNKSIDEDKLNDLNEDESESAKSIIFIDSDEEAPLYEFDYLDLKKNLI